MAERGAGQSRAAKFNEVKTPLADSWGAAIDVSAMGSRALMGVLARTRASLRPGCQRCWRGCDLNRLYFRHGQTGNVRELGVSGLGHVEQAAQLGVSVFHEDMALVRGALHAIANVFAFAGLMYCAGVGRKSST